MGQAARTILATITVAAVGSAALASVTHGFRAATSEGARRLEVARAPASIPDVQGVDQSGMIHGLFTDTAPHRTARVAIVVFIYTRCAEVCSATGSALQYLQRQIQTRHLDDRVRLVSVSFDPDRDTRDVLAMYARQRSSDASVWTIEAPLRPSQLPAVLKAFGVVVLKTSSNDFQHNAAFHVIDSNGRLARIVDVDGADRALAQALKLAAGATP